MKVRSWAWLFALVFLTGAFMVAEVRAADRQEDAEEEEEARPKKQRKRQAEDEEEEEARPKKRKSKKAKRPAPQRMIVVIDKFDSKADMNANQFQTLRARIQHRILGTRKFEVMEREQLKKVLSEQMLATKGMTNADDVKAPEQGKLKAAGYVLYGNILSFGRDSASGNSGEVTSARATAKIEIQLKITNAETGKVLASKVVTGVGTISKIASDGVSQRGNYSEQIERDAIDKGAAMVVDALRDLCYPAKVVAISKRTVTINMTQEEVQEDDVFDVIEPGENMVDPDTGVSLGNDGDDIGRIRITRPGTMTSKAVPIDGLDIDDIEVGCIVRRVPPERLKKEAKRRYKKAQEAFESRF